ncbi:MAG: TonB-dependent receptor [candidate division Zixibacteria bacterium]
MYIPDIGISIMRTYKVCVVSICLLSFFSMAVCAGEVSDINELDFDGLLDDIVFSASRHAETLEESPANVFIITKEMIDNFGFLDIGEALSVVPGLYITDDYSLSQIGVRGISAFGAWNSHVMVLVNGRPITEQYAGTNSIDLPGVDIGDIERIEVIKGPSSSIYGSNAFFGIVNLITHQATDDELSLRSSYYSEMGQRSGSYRLFHRVNNDFQITSFGTIFDRKGNRLYFEEFSDLSDGTLLSLDDDGYNQFYLDSTDFTGGYADQKNRMEKYFSHHQINWKKFYATLHFSKMITRLAHSAWGSLFAKEDNHYREKRNYFDVGYSNALSEKVEIDARFFYNYYEWSDHILYNYAEWEVSPIYLPGPIWADYEFNEWYGGDVRIHLNLSEKNNIHLGGDFQLHKIWHSSGETDAGGERVLSNVIPSENQRNDGQIFNIFVQNDYKFSDKLKTVAGLHFNYYSYTTAGITPKAAIIYKPEKNANLKFIVSRGFRSPSFYEITYTDEEYYAPNPDLEPENITSFELIASYDFPYGVSFEIAGNHSRMADLILQSYLDISDPNHPGEDFVDGTLQFRNSGKLHSNSIELSFKRNPIYRLSGFGNITYQKLDNSSGSEDGVAYNSPRWLGNLGVTYQVLPRKINLSSRIRYISTRALWDGTWLKSNTLVDVNIYAPKLFGQTSFTLGVKNLFDEEYREPMAYDYYPTASIVRPGRSIYLKLSTALNW